MTQSNASQVVIVGAGFGGLYAARTLAKVRGLPIEVTLVDRQNHHLFQPLLYQVATAGLNPSDIAAPIRSLVSKYDNVKVRQADVRSIDLSHRQVILDNGMLPYDFLILAAGVGHSYFGKPEWEAFAPGLKTLDDALEIRKRVLTALENAENEPDPAKKKAWLTFAIVGAGPTGVELAGAVSELARFTVAKDFRSFDPRNSQILLVEAGPRILTAFDEKLAAKGLAALNHLGVEVRLNARVTDVDENGLQLGDTFVEAKTVLWAAGVSGAPVAMQQGRHGAENILRTLSKKPTRDFVYFDKGIMATVGRAQGLAQSGPLRLSGFIGWLAWLFIHLIFLVDFRSKLVVSLQWAWAWLFYTRSARLITGKTPSPQPKERASRL